MTHVSYWALPGMKKDYSPNIVVYHIVQYFSIEYSDLISPSRKMDVVKARQIGMYILRNHSSLPFKKIGKMFNRDHSTVMHSVTYIEERKEWEEYKKPIDDIISLLFSSNFNTL